VTELPHDIPEHWLSQIREAVKADHPSTLWNLLGSAVLAALIGAGSAIGTAYVTIKASEDLEVKKSQLELSRSETSATLRSYNSLDKSLSELREKYDGIASLIRIAGADNQLAKPKNASNVRSQISKLGEKLGEVIQLKSDSHIDPRVWIEVNKPIQELTVAIEASNSDLASFATQSQSIEIDLNGAHDRGRQAEAELRKSSMTPTA